MSLLELDGVRKSFGDNVVLRDIDLTVERGQCVVLIGASGSGKSTLLRCVNLLEVVDDGRIILEGDDITDPRVDADAVRARMGVVFQAYNLFPHLSVLDNITLAPVRVHKVARAEARRAGHGDARAGRAGRPRATPAPTSCPAGSSSGSPSPGRWSTTPP